MVVLSYEKIKKCDEFTAVMSFSVPPKLPIGVLAALTITTSLIVLLL
jgi:hypothetical protein